MDMTPELVKRLAEAAELPLREDEVPALAQIAGAFTDGARRIPNESLLRREPSPAFRVPPPEEQL
jgi:hypothetical protein